MPAKKELWPVMLTPFTEGGEVDYNALAALIDWYQEGGADGLFAGCQSSEIFYLSLEERVRVASFVKKHASIPVIASGHVSWGREAQADELNRIADTGVDALILISNRVAAVEEGEEIFLARLGELMDKLPRETHLGFYECPHPEKRLLSLSELRFLAESGRFYFLKDTCCDLALIRRRLTAIEGSPLRLYNANSATLLASVQAGAAGFSGVMANFYPEMFAWLLKNYEEHPQEAELLQATLSTFALIERQTYPTNSKYYLQKQGLPITLCSRTRKWQTLSATDRLEVDQMDLLAQSIKNQLGIR